MEGNQCWVDKTALLRDEREALFYKNHDSVSCLGMGKRKDSRIVRGLSMFSYHYHFNA